MKEKCFKFSYIKLNQRFLQYHRGKGDFSVQKLGLLFRNQYLLTLFPAEAVAMK